MSRIIALLDACVLYPAPLRDLFMHLAVAGAFQARWSDTIHEEWTCNVLADRPDLTIAQLNRTRALMNRHAEGSLVEGYEHVIPRLTLPDPNDRHVLAAAIIAEADTIVTANIKDFPAATLALFEINAQKPDVFLCRLFAENPEKVIEAARNQRQALTNPPKTTAEYLATLTGNGLTRFVATLAPHAEEL